MAIGPRLDLRQSQTLVMTPQLRQAIQLLQFSNIEVTAFVEQELERNPLLERDESSDTAAAERPAAAPSAPGGPADGYSRTGSGGAHDFGGDERGIDDFAEGAATLREHLSEQLRLSFHDPAERVIGATLIALLEPSGRLAVASEAIAYTIGTDTARVEAVRERMMRFDPTGMFARDLRECLAVQLAERNRLDPIMQALLDNLELLGRRDHRRLMTLCEVDAEELTEMIAELRRLAPKPAPNWDPSPPMPLVPDVLMRPAPDGSWILELNPETLPRVLVNQTFSA